MPPSLENYIVNFEILRGGNSTLNKVNVSVSSSNVFNFIFSCLLSLEALSLTDLDSAFKLNESILAVS